MSEEKKSLWATAARPAAIWVGVAALGYSGLIKPILDYIFVIFQGVGVIDLTVSPPPNLESGTLMAVVTALIGISSMRSYDKKNGTETNKLK